LLERQFSSAFFGRVIDFHSILPFIREQRLSQLFRETVTEMMTVEYARSKGNFAIALRFL
jgi:hypothetical protein